MSHQHQAAQALDWGSRIQGENIALIPAFDNARNVLPMLLIQVGGFWLVRQDGTLIDSKELRDNQSLNTVPVNIHCDLVVAGVQARNVIAAVFCTSLKAVLLENDEDSFESFMTGFCKGFDEVAMKKVRAHLADNGHIFESAAITVAAAL